MNDGFELVKEPCLGASQERRKNNGEACFIEANYMVQGHWHRGSIQNISDGGAYISLIRGEQQLQLLSICPRPGIQTEHNDTKEKVENILLPSALLLRAVDQT